MVCSMCIRHSLGVKGQGKKANLHFFMEEAVHIWQKIAYGGQMTMLKILKFCLFGP